MPVAAFGWVFGLNALGVIGAGQLNRTQWYPGNQSSNGTRVGGDFALWRVGLRGCVVFGSGKVLAGLAKRIVPSLNATAVGTPQDIEAALSALSR